MLLKCKVMYKTESRWVLASFPGSYPFLCGGSEPCNAGNPHLDSSFVPPFLCESEPAYKARWEYHLPPGFTLKAGRLMGLLMLGGIIYAFGVVQTPYKSTASLAFLQLHSSNLFTILTS